METMMEQFDKYNFPDFCQEYHGGRCEQFFFLVHDYKPEIQTIQADKHFKPKFFQALAWVWLGLRYNLTQSSTA